jgi:Flp pilus assembly protein TadB
MLFFLFIAYTLFLIASRKSDERDARLQQRVAEALRDVTRTSDEAIKISRDDLMGENVALNRVLNALNLAKRLETMIAQADTQMTVSRLLGFSLVIGLITAFAAYTVMNGIFAIGIFFMSAAIPFLHIGIKRRKRLLKFNSQCLIRWIS